MEKLNEILLIDDNEIDNLIHSRLIKELSLAENVQVFLNGKSALFHLKELIKKNPQNLPDLILLDLNMPIMDGWTFLNEFEKLQTQLPKNIKIYIVSCSINKREIQKALGNKQVIDFISKPVTADRMRQITQKECLRA